MVSSLSHHFLELPSNLSFTARNTETLASGYRQNRIQHRKPSTTSMRCFDRELLGNCHQRGPQMLSVK